MWKGTWGDGHVAAGQGPGSALQAQLGLRGPLRRPSPEPGRARAVGDADACLSNAGILLSGTCWGGRRPGARPPPRRRQQTFRSETAQPCFSKPAHLPVLKVVPCSCLRSLPSLHTETRLWAP